MPEKVMKPCSRCHGTGQIITGGHQNPCHECEGRGYSLVNRDVYYRELRRELRNARYNK